ncbi:MAG: glycosyltransferase family 39 protein, partial [Acidimicrobiales bacterium]|nr:glycosyltransferase family 39 protein [Acidimicrobiales bacterium]
MLPVVSWVRRHDRAATAVALAFICLFGFVLRVWNLNWDEGTHQHPDERFWSIVTNDIAAPSDPLEYLDSASSPLNPYNRGHSTFVYGTLPLFATKGIAAYLHDGPPPAGAIVGALDAVGIDLRDNGQDRFDAGYDVNLIGRLLSALLDTATIAVVFALGTTLYDRRVGLVAALLQASAVLHIQYSHFHGGEIWVTFFGTLVVLGSVRLARQPSTRLSIGTGAALGLALASKFTAAAAVLVPMVALLVWLAPDVRTAVTDLASRIRYGRDGTRARGVGQDSLAIQRAFAVLGCALWVGFSAFIVFRILQPYAFDGLLLDDRFRADLDYISGVNTGESSVPWTIQWIGATPLVHPLSTAFWWGMGPALGLAVAAGIVLAAADVVRRRRYEVLVPLSLLVLLIGLVSRQFNPLIRYLLPGYPVAIVLGAAALVRVWDHRPSRLLRVVPVALIGLTVMYGLAFTNGVYGNEHPRIAASRWIDENIPDGSMLSAQLWDDALPLGLPGIDTNRWPHVQLDPFFPDNAAEQVFDEDGQVVSVVPKVDGLLAALDQADYVVEASNKLYGAIPRFPAKYPATTAYYAALFDGSLGFEQVAQFRNGPSLFGIGIDTSGAEETFTVYDDPTVTIWRKTDGYSSERARAIVNGDAARAGVDLPPAEAATNALLLTPDDAASQQGGGTWSDVFDPDAPTSTLPWLWWLVWLEVAALAAVP